MTRPPRPKCPCGATLTARDLARGYATCGMTCALREQARRLDAMRAETPSDDEVLDGLVRLREER